MTDRLLLYILALFSGAAALAWEVLWQLKASLALGASAWGAALTLAVAMGGMSAGAAAAGALLRGRPAARPLRLYGLLQIAIGVGGLWLGPAFRAMEALDTRLFALLPAAAPPAHGLGLAIVLGIPAFCMGASFPPLALAVRRRGACVARLYGVNTLGAAAGTLATAFALIPAFGVAGAGGIAAGVNFAVGILAVFSDRASCSQEIPLSTPPAASNDRPSAAAIATVCVTGFAMFSLEVVWFRALISAFKGTTDAFAILLASVLLSLAAAAACVPRLRRVGAPLPTLIAAAGMAILIATPAVERFDLIIGGRDKIPILLIFKWFGLTLLAIGPPTFLLGIALPWLLEDCRSPRAWGALSAANTLAAVAGALGAGWLLLPAIGLARTAWLSGAAVAAAGIARAPAGRRLGIAVGASAALALAVAFESGLGVSRVQFGVTRGPYRVVRVLDSFDGPDATFAAVETAAGDRLLMINGFLASAQTGRPTADRDPSHYMRWMGHLPMLLHPAPRRALVICFGIGLTANAVRAERPAALDAVDLSERVFRMARHFPANEDVLDDPIVRPIVMDGRAWLRRTTEIYDVITLEPMPPNFAGMNALYSREFYAQAARKLSPDGVLAQWVPLHLTPSEYAVSVARTFLEVFPNALLWVDPVSGTGILVGAKNARPPIGLAWPGFARLGLARGLTESQVREAIALDPAALARYAAPGRVITDDNQLLAYGPAVLLSHRHMRRIREENQQRLDAAAAETGMEND